MDVLIPPQQLPDKEVTIGDVNPLLLVNNLEHVLFQVFFGDLVINIEDISVVELVVLTLRDLHRLHPPHGHNVGDLLLC